MGINKCQNTLSNKLRICAFYCTYVIPQKISNKYTTVIEGSLCQGQVRNPHTRDVRHGQRNLVKSPWSPFDRGGTRLAETGTLRPQYKPLGLKAECSTKKGTQWGRRGICWADWEGGLIGWEMNSHLLYCNHRNNCQPGQASQATPDPSGPCEKYLWPALF